MHLKVYLNGFPLWWLKVSEHSPELRQTRVLLPERFTSSACSFGATKVVSPLVVIRIHKIIKFGHTNYTSKINYLIKIFKTFKAIIILPLKQYIEQ
ncbi:hypothetical protein BACCIP111895_02445 [Neobacillus rhizosphaerae]|uniref:Uncharacterized protein n=1 Tax=Neobacillus rhizosphaerae TaxID=2880965 RepID=A0ABM9ERL5_9BACI|nr:hypothetical protein BACCIP111895_02445 [Neobacillus rhizosphaerae]